MASLLYGQVLILYLFIFYILLSLAAAAIHSLFKFIDTNVENLI